jgi:hypothetical protein
MVFKIVNSAEQEKIRPFFFFSRHFENFIEKNIQVLKLLALWYKNTILNDRYKGRKKFI